MSKRRKNQHEQETNIDNEGAVGSNFRYVDNEQGRGLQNVVPPKPRGGRPPKTRRNDVGIPVPPANASPQHGLGQIGPTLTPPASAPTPAATEDSLPTIYGMRAGSVWQDATLGEQPNQPLQRGRGLLARIRVSKNNLGQGRGKRNGNAESSSQPCPRTDEFQISDPRISNSLPEPSRRNVRGGIAAGVQSTRTGLNDSQMEVLSKFVDSLLGFRK